MSETHLDRSLGLKEATAIVIGTIIGTGIFLKSGIMAQTVGSPLIVLLAWLLGGMLSLAGALTYAELGCLFPRSGGEFVYLQEAYGRVPAFLYGWMRFVIGAPGSIAAYGVGAATFLSALFIGWTLTTRTFVAMGFVLFFTLINCLNVAMGGRVQVILTALKVLVIVVLIFGAFFLSHGTVHNLMTPAGYIWQGWSAFGAAVLAALWAFDGWNNLPMASGEVKDAQRNVPRALIIGIFTVLLVYGLLNIGYFFALPFSEVLTTSSPAHVSALPIATKAASVFMGSNGLIFLSIALTISALGAMHGSILVNARVPFAMAQEKIFFKALAYIHPKTASPIVAILVQGFIACLLAASGSYDQLTDYVVFWSWVFYALCGFSVFIFRKKMPNVPRAYKVPGYPVVPIIFLLVAVWLLLSALISSPREAAVGFVIILAGLPFYFLFRKKA
jgi:APA family basic amino acid/polyamine antiporter